MNLIVAVDENWAIGYKNELLIRIPADMKMFRQETTGKVVVLGRKTLETFPGGQPLKNRTNIILSSNKDYKVKDGIVVHSIEELLKELKNYKNEEIYITGGETVYRLEANNFCSACTYPSHFETVEKNTIRPRFPWKSS